MQQQQQQQGVAYPNQTQVHVVTTRTQPSHPPGVNPYYYSNASIGLGATQVVIGILAFLFQCVGIGVNAPLAPGGTGIWMGIFFTVTGGLGIAAGKTNKKSFIISFMVMSILAIFLACGLVGVSSTSLIIANVATGYNCNYENWYGDNVEAYDDCHRERKAQSASDGALLILGVVEFFIAIISSGFGCGGLCCCVGPSGTQSAYYNQGTVVVQGGVYSTQMQQSNAVQGQVYPTQPPTYQSHVYPQPGQGYPQPGQGYPQQGQGYPQQGQGYPQPGQVYPQPGQANQAYPQGQAYAPQGQAYPPPNQVYPQQGQANPQESQPPPYADSNQEKAKF